MCASKHPTPFSMDKGFEIPSIPLVLIKIIQTLDENTSSAKELETLMARGLAPEQAVELIVSGILR